MQKKAPVSGFVVGHYIAAGTPKTVAAHLKNIDGMDVGKKGLIPGPAVNSRFIQIH